ncbi:MAG: hypothetical protein HQM16_07115 [Deltaproteobacteria bacterium]|nr:hypothetical protein [Deltaproteobacteria bacterium]
MINKAKIITVALSLFILNCQLTVGSTQTDNDTDTIASISGTPSDYSQSIYTTEDLSDLCLSAACEAPYSLIPDTFKSVYDETNPDTCHFDDNPNSSSQFIIKKETSGVNDLHLLLSKEDLFFLAWASLRYKINPHFLMGVMAQESYGNCAAVSSADAEGCFQITNYYGRLQLQQSFADRVLSWHWNDNPDGYYPDSLFINPLTWFGETPESDQFRMTLDPSAGTVLGVAVSSVVNFNFGVIASALYYHWEQYFLYHNYSSLQSLVETLVEQNSEAKSSLMAAAYNGGMGTLTSALNQYDSDYLDHLPAETYNYVDRVLYYCQGFQGGASAYTATYNSDEMEYIIDLLQMTYDDSLDIDWDTLKQDVITNFYATQESLSFVDDIKAVIWFISTYDTALAPVWADDVVE